MIFAYATDERALMIFPDEAHACSYCEIYDVRDRTWLFFDANGRPLTAAVPPLPTGRIARFFTNPGGTYTLHPQHDPPESAMLLALLPRVAGVDVEPLRRQRSPLADQLVSVDGVRTYLETKT